MTDCTDVLNKNMVVGEAKRQRASNLELLRIFAMMAIIAHHSIVNSTVFDHIDYANPDINTYFLMVWGMWGKTAINSFILISGYFLCKGSLTWQRFVKLLAEVYFYKIVVAALFMAFGCQSISAGSLVKMILSPLVNVNNGFTPSFLAFYMFVPIYNTLIRSLDERRHRLMICGLLMYFTIAGTMWFTRIMNEPLWYATLYIVAAYIRLYPNRWTESLRRSCVMFSASVALAVCTVVAFMFVTSNPGLFHLSPALAGAFCGKSPFIYWFVEDSNKLLAVAVGLSAFLVAKNMPVFYSRFINTMAAGTFGVLLIHAASDTMREWLWQEIFDIPSLAASSVLRSAMLLVPIPFVVFTVCSSADYLRRRWIERPMMDWLNRF